MSNYMMVLKELDHLERGRLYRAADPLGVYGDRQAEAQYVKYRNKGHAPGDALLYTVAWATNAADQAQRRRGHDTGA